MEDGGTNVESLVPPPNLNSEDESKREEEQVEEGVEKVKEEDIGKEDSDGGGLINNFISFITPLSPSIGKPSQHESADDGGEKGEEGEKGGVDGCEEGGGGVIRKMVSSFFHQREGEGEGVVGSEEEKEEEEIMAGEKVKRLKTENGGIIHNIASHLPASVPDGAVPTADEATFLINSLVRD